jgi:uncharacterized membrane protein YhaH (DUF805 family)
MSWYLKVLRNYATFSGRARRQEFWMFVLFNVIFAFALRVVDHIAGLTYGPNGSQGILHSIYMLLVLIPGIAVATRRLHDIGKSGWYLFVAFVPCIGGLMLLYWYILEGNPGTNDYGADPKSA